MSPRSPLRKPPESRRVEGIFPFALQRALELEAVYQIVIPLDLDHNEPAWRTWIAGFHPRSLHGFMGRYLATHPERRLL